MIVIPPLLFAVTFVEFSSESYTVSESENFVVLVITKTGVTQEDVPVIVSLLDGTAEGKVIYNKIHAHSQIYIPIIPLIHIPILANPLMSLCAQLVVILTMAHSTLQVCL